MTKADEVLKQLEEAAREATPGPWEEAQWCSDDGEWVAVGPKHHQLDDDELDPDPEAGDASTRDARFIALANPTTILALIKALETATNALCRIAIGDAVQASTMHAIAVEALEAIEKEMG